MAEILTTNFKTDTTKLFTASALSSEYYLFASSINATVSNNGMRSTNNFLENTLFGKKVLNENKLFMIKYYPWQSGLVYTQYDDIEDLEDVNFYSVVGPNSNDTGDYRVYKCLNNNFGAKVSSPPNYSGVTVDQIYRTADGYVWKHMYALTEIEFDAYNAIGYIPIIGSFDISPQHITNGSPISDIIVENIDSNNGYTVDTGTIETVYAAGSAKQDEMQMRPTTELNQTLNYYVGQSIYITNTSGVSFLFEVTYYSYGVGGLPVISVDVTNGTPNSLGILRGATFSFLPRIEILGDGTGAQAVPNISNSKINSISILNSGTGYNNLSVRVVDPEFNFDPENANTVEISAEVRGILAPKDGHAYNLLEEFKCRHMLLYAYITADNNNNIGATNTYGTVGFVKNPEFANTSPAVFDNRIAVTTDDIGSVLVNTIITQVDNNNKTIFSGKVHEVNLSTNTMYIAEHCGPYQNVGNTSISFSEDYPFRSETGQTININTPINTNVITPEYTQRTGEVYFMEDFFPLDRNILSREEFKLVLEF
jgi:hypothetical protein